MSINILILGGSGRFGRHVTQSLRDLGHCPHLFDRSCDDLAQWANWADVIVNGWNPQYPDWFRDIMPMTRHLIAAIQGTPKRVILAGNVYNYGPDAPPPWGPQTPHLAHNPMGRLRIQMERAYRDAGIATIILRSGDFLDTEASGNWFDRVMAPTLQRGILTYPVDTDAAHSWAYLPDVGRILAELVARHQHLPQFVDIPFAGYTLTPQDWQGALSAHLGRDIRIKPLNWLPLYAAYPVWPMARRLIEMRYLWALPHHLDATPLTQVLPDFHPTPLAQALEHILKH